MMLTIIKSQPPLYQVLFFWLFVHVQPIHVGTVFPLDIFINLMLTQLPNTDACKAPMDTVEPQR